jgi:hypothetical protein
MEVLSKYHHCNMSCSCAHFQQCQHHYLAEAVGVSAAPSPHVVSGSLHIFGEAPRRGSEMMLRAFSRTVRNHSFSLSFSTRQTYSVCPGQSGPSLALQRVCRSHGLGPKDYCTDRQGYSGLLRDAVEGSNRQSNRFGGFPLPVTQLTTVN